MFVADPSPPIGVLLATLARRLSGRGRSGRDQPLHRARHRRPHDAHVAASASVRARRAAPRAVVRHRARRRCRSRCSRVGGQHDRRAAGDGRPARLRVRLHAVAEAAHDAEHRDRRRRGGGAAAGRLGRRRRQPRPFGVLPVRDRLLLDAAALLGARAADQGRLRAHGHPDAAGRRRRARDAAPDPALRLAAARDHGAARWRAACSAPSTRSPPLVLGAALPLSVRAPAPAGRPALGGDPVPLLAAYLALLFCAMAVDRVV